MIEHGYGWTEVGLCESLSSSSIGDINDGWVDVVVGGGGVVSGCERRWGVVLVWCGEGGRGT